MTDRQAELVLDARAELGEGAIWDPQGQRLWWIDIEQALVHVHDPRTGTNRSLPVGRKPGTLVMRRAGGLVVALADAIAALDPDTGRIEPLAPNPDFAIAHLRFNDGKCDPAGRFWVGSYGSTPGVLYRLDPDRSLHPMVPGVGCSNGIVWTADRRTMYFIDTTLGRVDAFDYDDAAGTVTNRRTAFTLPAGWGAPDGSTLDADGNLWVASWGGGNVSCFDPRTGRLLHRIDVPAAKVTSCAFGGPNLDTLYITSARGWTEPAELAKTPQAGGLFACTPGVRGVPAQEFLG